MRCPRIWVFIILIAMLLPTGSIHAAHFNYRVIAPDMVGEDVYYLQGFLTQLGFYKGDLTEHYDYDTQQSVISFQQSYRLPVSGWVDGNTATALLSTVNQQANLVVDGQYQLLSPPPVIADDLFYLPIEAVERVFGIGSEIKKDELRLLFRSEIWPLSLADERGRPYLDTAGLPTARQWNGTLYLPLRSLATWVGATVSWDALTRTAHVGLPVDHRPYQASGVHFLRRLTLTAYPDRMRIIFHLSSTIQETYAPRGLNRDTLAGTWRGQLNGLTMGEDAQELIINDPTVRMVRLVQSKGALTLTVTPSDGQQIARCEWLIDLEHDRLILDLYRAQ